MGVMQNKTILSVFVLAIFAGFCLLYMPVPEPLERLSSADQQHARPELPSQPAGAKPAVEADAGMNSEAHALRCFRDGPLTGLAVAKQWQEKLAAQQVVAWILPHEGAELQRYVVLYRAERDRMLALRKALAAQAGQSAKPDQSADWQMLADKGRISGIAFGVYQNPIAAAVRRDWLAQRWPTYGAGFSVEAQASIKRRYDLIYGLSAEQQLPQTLRVKQQQVPCPADAVSASVDTAE